LNVNGYFDGLLQFLDQTVEHGYLREQQRGTLIVDSEPQALLVKLR
ncbi:MAG TPA: TIGR00730 family Rossman fold protein, partial [Planctomycetes bacterium]|nr:TIGR00730 family Rossman fold protein [Planctomycetota bacterium]